MQSNTMTDNDSVSHQFHVMSSSRLTNMPDSTKTDLSNVENFEKNGFLNICGILSKDVIERIRNVVEEAHTKLITKSKDKTNVLTGWTEVTECPDVKYAQSNLKRQITQSNELKDLISGILTKPLSCITAIDSVCVRTIAPDDYTGIHTVGLHMTCRTTTSSCTATRDS